MSVSARLQTLGSSAGLRAVGNILLWGAVPLAIGWLLSIYLIPQPAVGIITAGYEVNSITTPVYMEEIREAREDPRIKAVVVRFSSPGGASTQGQALYLELQHLRREMPVVGSVDDMAASAAYRMAVATEPIYAKPGSLIGNVGIWAYFPSEVPIDEYILASGPFKLGADNEAEFVRRIEEAKKEFLSTVFSQRGERLKLTRAQLSQGLLYSGNEALRLGLIDHIGGQTEAIKAAARQAGLANYEVVDLEARALENLFGDLVDQSGLKRTETFSRRTIEELEDDPFMLLELWPGALAPRVDASHLPQDRDQMDHLRSGGTP